MGTVDNAVADRREGKSRQGGQESGSQRTGQAGSAVQGRGAGLEESGKNRHSWHGAQGIGGGKEGLPGGGQVKKGHQGAGSKGQGKTGRAGKERGKAGARGFMGVFPGKGMGWWRGVVPPAIPPFPPPPYPAVGMVYPAQLAYPPVP